MKKESYTPGHSTNATTFMAQRSFESHGQFFDSYIQPGLSVLDCGCGPGSITFGLARRAAPGLVVGVDRGESQITQANIASHDLLISNVKFHTADCYSLPFEADKFDRAFAHALLEHLSEPIQALTEIHRVLKPAGLIGVCSPDWGGFILAPPSAELRSAVTAYQNLQMKNGGDVEVGRKLGKHLSAAGFKVIQMSARYECYSSLEFIGEYLAIQIERSGDEGSARTFRSWSKDSSGMFAQAWVSAVGQKA